MQIDASPPNEFDEVFFFCSYEKIPCAAYAVRLEQVSRLEMFSFGCRFALSLLVILLLLSLDFAPSALAIKVR